MVFSSYEFIIFLAVVAGAHLWLESYGSLTVRKVFLIAASLVFYAWWRVDALALLLGSIGVNYAIGTHLRRPGVRTAPWAALGVVFNLGLLGVFKYMGLFDQTLAALTGQGLSLPAVFLPLGISFFTFQQISYIVDTAKGTAPAYTPIDYLLFICFFPHLIAGPIVLHHELIPQFSIRRTAQERWGDLGVGLTLFTMGLFKKVLIADSVAPNADVVFNLASHGTRVGTTDAWIAVLSFALQIYFDFSAYTDMALGAARTLGIKLPINFNSPYKSASIIEFWRRWHISLSSFLRNYLYIPLGGNRGGSARRYLNLMLTMLIGGLWHGANWTFMVWGGLHGLYLCINHAWNHVAKGIAAPAWAARIGRPLAVLLTFAATLVAWTFFRAQTFGGAVDMLAAMAGQGGATVILKTDAGTVGTLVVLLGMVFFAPNTIEMMRDYAPALNMQPFDARSRPVWRPTPRMAVIMGLAFLISLFAISNLRPFIYYQF